MEVDRKLVNKRNLNEVLKIVAEGIKDTLNFEWVNISLISPASELVKSLYVLGLSEEDTKEFKEMGIHPTNDRDIQADIAKTQKVEVISDWDDRFDRKIYDRFGHKDLIRVFVPILAPSTGEAIGTVEAGHRKDYRNFIDERDVSFLRAIVANAAELLDPLERSFLARIRHEFTSSIVGIKSHTNFLQKYRNIVRENVVENKLSDILTDCDILQIYVEEIESILGQQSQKNNVEEVLVVRDIIFKTVNQLKPLVKESKFSPDKIDYPRDEGKRIKIYVEKAKLNQVVFNLVINSIKYAKNNPADFKVEIAINETKEDFIIEFSDWGIGIKKEYKEEIFRFGFRSPEARAIDVYGSGMGLSIARERIIEIGGDLILTHYSNPTTFHLIIPKILMEKPK